MAKKPLTETQKIEKFMTWLKASKTDAVDDAFGSSSSWNHAAAMAFKKVHTKAQSIFKK